MIPAWCAPPSRLLGREATLEQAHALLRDGPITLVGPAGVGTTSAAGALARMLVEEGRCAAFAAVPVDASASRGDLFLSIGLQLGCLLVGDETSVVEALARPDTVILLDDADLAGDVVRPLVDLAPTATWILTGREPVAGHAVPVPPLTDVQMAELVPPGRSLEACRGRPLLAALPETLQPDDDWPEALLAASPGLQRLVNLPAGSPAHATDARGFGVRHIGSRVVARRAVREALGRPLRPDPTTLAASIDEHAETLHQLACDLLVHNDPMNLRALRTGATVIDDPALRALSAAAAARIHLRSFQASDALELARSAQVGIRLPHLARAVLRWVEGDALLTQGSDDLAHEAHLSAASEFRGPDAAPMRIVLARRCADAWVARGHRARAQKWISLARSELARAPDPAGLADTLRINGNLAAQSGELVGARALYEEALATLGSDGGASAERAFVRIGLAAIATSDRAFSEALEHLELASTEAEGHPLAEAAVAWRRAEIALRRGRRGAARSALATASEGFRRAGTLRGLLLCARMEGDLAAVSGDRSRAVQAWDQAMTLCVRTRNLAGLRRILRRRLVVEREGLPGPHVAELQEHLDRAEVLLGTSS